MCKYTSWGFLRFKFGSTNIDNQVFNPFTDRESLQLGRVSLLQNKESVSPLCIITIRLLNYVLALAFIVTCYWPRHDKIYWYRMSRLALEDY
jgi:hypothetical protein